jgi:GntR family transcriptional regulator
MADPMYKTIADELARRIESGELPPGELLPSEEALREEYGRDGRNVSRNTVRDAVKLLVSRGLVETRPGQGTFVLWAIVPFVTKLKTDLELGGGEETVYESEVKRQGREPEPTRPRVEVQPPTDLVARQLELEKGAQVISRHQQRRIDGVPWSLQTSFYSMELVTTGGATQLLMAQDFPDGMVKTLEDSLGIKQVGWRDTFIARPPNPEERAFFGLSDRVQVAVFETRRTGYDQNGKPIRFTVTVYPADRNLFEMETGDVPPAPTLPTTPGRDRSP